MIDFERLEYDSKVRELMAAAEPALVHLTGWELDRLVEAFALVTDHREAHRERVTELTAGPDGQIVRKPWVPSTSWVPSTERPDPADETREW